MSESTKHDELRRCLFAKSLNTITRDFDSKKIAPSLSANRKLPGRGVCCFRVTFYLRGLGGWLDGFSKLLRGDLIEALQEGFAPGFDVQDMLTRVVIIKADFHQVPFFEHSDD